MPIELRNVIILWVSATLLATFLIWTIMNGMWYVPFLMVLGVIIFILVLLFPRITLFSLLSGRIIIDLLHWVPVTIFNLNLLAVYSGGATIICLLFFLQRFKRDIEFHKSIHLFLVWNVFIGIQIVLSDFSTNTIDEAFRSFSPILLLMLGSSLLIQKNDPRKMLLVIAITGLVPIGLSLYYWQTGQMARDEALIQGIPRLLGGYKNLRHHALIMMILSGVGIYFSLTAKRWWNRFFWSGYTLSTSICMYLTMIRSCLLVWAIFLSLFFWMTNRRSVSAISIAAVFLALFFNETLQDRFRDLILVFTLSSETDFESLAKIGSGRYGMWTESWTAYQQKPFLKRLIGLGFGEHYELIRTSFFAFDAKSSRNLDTHNDILRILYNLGPFALFCYLGMAFQCIRIGVKINRANLPKEERDLGAMCACIMIGLLLNNCLSNGTFSRITIGWLFWVLGGILFGYVKQLKAQKRPSTVVAKQTDVSFGLNHYSN